MQVKPHNIEQSLKSEWRNFFIFGTDIGMISITVSKIRKYFDNDGVNASIIDYKELYSNYALIKQHLSGGLLLGGCSVVVIDNVPEKCDLEIFNDFQGSASSVVVFKAAEVKKTSKLYKHISLLKGYVTIPCYKLGELELAKYIYDYITNHDILIEYTLCQYLAGIFPNNIQLISLELDKLILYIGKERARIEEQDCKAVFHDYAEFILDDFAAAILLGDFRYIKKHIANILEDDNKHIALIRGLATYFRRVRLVKTHIINDNYSITEALAKLYPPVFFGHKEKFIEVVSKTSLLRLKSVLKNTLDIELEYKKIPIDKEVAIYHMLLSLIA